MNFTDRLKILEMSRLARATPIGRDLVSAAARSNTLVKLLCNLTKELTQGIWTIALKFTTRRVPPDPTQ